MWFYTYQYVDYSTSNSHLREWGRGSILSVMIYTPAQACLILDISTSTLRNYCDVAADFLSKQAVPAPKKHRSFTEDDMRILMVVKSARDYGDALERLRNGERVDIPSGNSEYFLSLDSRDQILLLENRIIQLQAQVVELQDEHDRRVAAEANVALLEKQLDRMQDKLDDAKDEIRQLKLDLRDRE